MKKLSLYIFLVLMFSFTINVYAWEKVPVPDSVDKKTKSPWNFYENFEDGKFRFKYVTNSKDISNSPGKKPYKIKKDLDGNSYLEITVKHKWNKCCRGNFYSERAEIETSKKNAKNKIIWYGFRVRFPKDFQHINDRLLFAQFVNVFNNFKKSPLMGMRLYQLGNKLVIGGDTGGIASKSWNRKEDKIHKVENIYFKNSSNQWILTKYKTRQSDEIHLWKCNIGKNNTYKLPEYCNKLMKQFQSTPPGEWTTYKIGIKNSKKEDGFVKVYKDDELIMDYKGITFNWKGSFKHTYIKFGPYRDSDPLGKGYPSQTIHYDDIIIVSDKKTLDKYLN